ncbi:protein of unknown function [Xenorhabdus doucetiae]|uniref:Uncharacterized protein n=1 Tax=Xenorhabdus doucetiae TaxID=351671 RepID=A0A068QPF6_9GAMM|nr:protein of unknown function [Xenorhabdus doucetiae]
MWHAIDPNKITVFSTNYSQKHCYMYTMKTNHGIDANKALGEKSPFSGEV